MSVFIYLYIAVGFGYSVAAREILNFWIENKSYRMVTNSNDFIIHWFFFGLRCF